MDIENLVEYKKQEKPKALIYCRVSGKKQTADGSGLSSQEYRCRQYAAEKCYEVEEVFPDEITGGGDYKKRDGMVALLKHIEDNPDTNYVVIFDDLKRYSRDTEFHLKLRRIMLERNATRECLNYTFMDSPEGKFNETVTAAAAEYERETMARQNMQKSIARLEQGYAVLAQPPVGYIYVKSENGGKILVKNEPAASIVQEALEGYAIGRFASQSEMTRFLNDHPDFPRKNGRKVTQWVAVKMLRQKLYAGIVESKGFNVSAREGKHEPIISYQTHKKILERLDGGVYTPARKDIKNDFPLRGTVSCRSCGDLLTAGWSKGKTKSYLYYRCWNSDCDECDMSISGTKMEKRFQELLEAIQPPREAYEMTAAMIKRCWEMLGDDEADRAKSIKKQIKAKDREIETTVQRAVAATIPEVISAYEKNIEKLKLDKLALVEKLETTQDKRGTFENLFELSMQFIANPCKIWDTGRLDLRKLMLRLVFSDRLRYCPEKGFLNSNLSLPFSALGGDSTLCVEYGAAEKI